MNRHFFAVWKYFGMSGGILAAALFGVGVPTSAAEAPNIVFIFADDLGYGDVHCLNPQRGKIPTPHIDRLAAQGMVFTDAHSTSSVCTPTRYSILTGRYNWRSKLQRGVLSPFAAPLIAEQRLTLPGLLRQHGYATACVGKWHLGWDWLRQGKTMDYARPINGGPITRGFDYYFGTDVPNYPPYCFIESNRTVGVPYEPLPEELLKNSLASEPGLAGPGWKLENILPALTDKACDYAREHARAERPFFLYFPMTSPHTPLAVSKEWQGRSGLGRYADFVMETDAMVGRLLEAVDQSGQAGRTLIVFTSDNGTAPAAKIPDLEKQGHFSSAQFRGHKADIWEGGHRLPFIVRWPGVVKPGSSSAQLVCQMDLMATVAEMLDAELPETAADDSFSLLPLLKGTDEPVRPYLIHHSFDGSFAIREAEWKLILCADSGGFRKLSAAEVASKGMPKVQLFNLSDDPGETHNLSECQPDIVERLTEMLESAVSRGRTTPGLRQTNDVEVVIQSKIK